MSGVEVIFKGDIKTHPRCPHGPTLLFQRAHDKTTFYACSACRDRKSCQFFLPEHELKKARSQKQKAWSADEKKFTAGVNHRKLYLQLVETTNQQPEDRAFCITCGTFEPQQFWDKHSAHELRKDISDLQLRYPTRDLLPPLEDAKKEAQFLFSRQCLEDFATILGNLGYKSVVCIGTPGLHEFIKNEKPGINTILLDFDRRYLSFYGPLEFCWYNAFNHHFFLPESEGVFDEFIRNSPDVAIVMDPPFGGRVEPLAHTLQTIDKEVQIPVFWFFPYFMESQIRNRLPDFRMLDYKVDYINHPLFHKGKKGRKLGSPVRIFTNVSPKKIKLPGDYRFCKKCKKWVSIENVHCDECGECTSKDGSTYVHCDKCERCVKPTWAHCETCQRCAQLDHQCGTLVFKQECFHCKKPGHKKRQCPVVDHEELHNKRKKRKNKD